MKRRLVYSAHYPEDDAVCVMLPRTSTIKSHDLNCEICGCAMIEQKCKIRCPNCGFTRDCSDP